MRFWRTRLTVGDPALATPLGFTIRSLGIENPTTQWILATPDLFVPPMQGGVVIVMVDELARAQFLAPTGQTNPPTQTGQFATLTYYDTELTPSSGVGILSQRAPYYDRNPTTIVRGNAGGTIRAANSGVNIEWTYTVPAGRKAFVEAAYVMVQINANYANDTAGLLTTLNVAPLGGGGSQIAIADIFVGTLKGTIAVGLLGTSMELQPTDQLLGVSADARAAGAGSSVHYVTAKLTEFDV